MEKLHSFNLTFYFYAGLGTFIIIGLSLVLMGHTEVCRNQPARTQILQHATNTVGPVAQTTGRHADNQLLQPSFTYFSVSFVRNWD